MKKRTPKRRGFTLVELLVVMAIIGILIALLVRSIYMVRRTTLNARITIELSGLSQAVEAYKMERGGHTPPNFNDLAVGQRPLAERFPRMSAAENELSRDLALASTAV